MSSLSQQAELRKEFCQNLSLTGKDAEYLITRGISLEVAKARGYTSALTNAALARLGFSRSQQRAPALILPVYDGTGDLAFYQQRPEQPRCLSKGGKVAKFESPAKSRMAVDVNPLIRKRLSDP